MSAFNPVFTATTEVATGTETYNPVTGASTFSGQIYTNQAPSSNQPTQPTNTQAGGNVMPQGTYNSGAGALAPGKPRGGLWTRAGWLGLPFWALFVLLVFVLTGISLTIYSLIRRRRRSED
jgi:hypothetical protein